MANIAEYAPVGTLRNFSTGAVGGTTKSDWGAYVPDLPGCVAVGKTRDDALQLIREAIVIHLRGMREDGDLIPEPTSFAETVVVEAA